MMNIELIKILEAAKDHYETSAKWFGYMLEAEDRNNLDYAKTCEHIWYEEEYKARGLLESFEILTGIEIHTYQLMNDFQMHVSIIEDKLA